MTTKKTYNGYANYETWAVFLWLGNEEGSYRYWREVAEEERREATPIYRLADRIKEEVTEGAPELEPSLYSDLLNAALSEVDWYEVAEAMLGE